MKFIEVVKGFFKPRKVDPADEAHAGALGTLLVAANAYDASRAAIEEHTTRAMHRIDILNSSPPVTMRVRLHDTAGAVTWKGYQYTEAELAAHTNAIERLTAAFDNLTTAFTALTNYSSACEMYRIYCDFYKSSADAYARAAHCAILTASECKMKAVTDEIDKVMMLEARAKNPLEANPAAVLARAAANKAKIAEDNAKAEALEERASAAEVRAEEFCVKAKSCHANVEEALRRKPNLAE